MLYTAYQSQIHAWLPLRAAARAAAPLLRNGIFDWAAPGVPPALAELHGHWRAACAAACDVLELAQITHRRPAYRIDEVEVGGRMQPVVEDEVLHAPFGTLLRFAKPGIEGEPKVLIVAPMSGHFATLLRDTVRTMAADHDVYLTDWRNARDVGLAAGRFGLDEYIEHLMTFIRVLGPKTNVVAVCQPCVAALAATALLAADDDPATPATLTLMAGPIDCRISPTAVNELASTRPIEWFERHLISRVPLPFAGVGRRVYPGFVQLAAFMSMNRQRHLESFGDYFAALLGSDEAKSEALRTFYEEYLAVADLPAEFYLETVERIFQQYRLPKGELEFRDRPVEPKAIRRTALVTVEGERDDICAVGQTLAAQDLCSSLRPYMRTHYVQPGVGHYGVFAGRKWQNHIYPLLREVIHAWR